ncbi:polymeric immunoglobulin receptor-like [Elgaria multicarinata webbii]|uniref:polymeric immunoglobulin receptor-like n=1 Tax=Elgaria multicarinata webbii TaxID=159646 RepID=UPI002FCD0CA8
MMTNILAVLVILIPVSDTIYGPRLLISRVGGSVTIPCYYETITANRHGRKYWCMESRGSCPTIISTNHFIHQDFKGRVSINDRPQNGIFEVTMTHLEKKDSSNYRCGIGKVNNGLYAGVNLTIWEGPNMPKSPEIVWGKLRGSVMIQCPSETTRLRMENKSLCKMRRSGCTTIVDTSRSKLQDRRITFTAGDSSETFSVSIKELRKTDSGVYKCGTGMWDGSSDARIIQLQVTEESLFFNIIRNINNISKSTARYESQTTFTTSHRLVTSTNDFYKKRSSENEQNPLPIVISLLVLLVLAAIVITVFVKLRQRRKNASSDIPPKNLEREMPPIGQKESEEKPEEENRDSEDERETAIGPAKGTAFSASVS